MTELVRYEKARQALLDAKTVDEVKQIRDKAEALRLYAIQAHDIELESWASAIKLRAQRRIGEISSKLEKVQPIHGKMRIPTSGKPKSQTLKDAGLSTSTAQRCEEIASVPEAEFEKYIKAKTEKKQSVSAKEVVRMVCKKTKRKKKVAALQEKNKPLPGGTKRYQIIYADPPWKYSHECMSESRHFENQYPVMTLDEIKALPVGEKLAAEDCLLLLWVTSPKVEEAISVMNAWGFKYRTCAVWVKDSIGAGYWFRQQHELLFVGVKGNIPTPIEADRISSVFHAKRKKHSEKPEEVREWIDRSYQGLEKIELFSRKKVKGWDNWGNET
jgi:N6-adenosine-specific RNA methylase IME4